MPGMVFSIQNTFSLGELSERLHARVDFEGYYKGAKRMRNILPIPQGGCKRRFGLRYLARIPGDIASPTEIDFGTLEYLNVGIYNIVFTPLNIYIYLGNVLKDTVVSPYTSSDVPNIKFTQTESAMIIVNPAFPTKLLQRDPADDTIWALTDAVFANYPVFDFTSNYFNINFTLSGIAPGTTITVTASSAIFGAQYVGGLFVANNGTLRLTVFTDTTHMDGYVVNAFDAVGPILGSSAYLAEPAFSATRGYPSTASFYQNRLVLGNTPQIPQGVFLSRTGQYFNFDESGSDDDYAIGILCRSSRSSIVQYVVGANALYVFTTRGIFCDKSNFGENITPSNPVVIQQNETGCANVAPIQLDNQIFYIDVGGKIVRTATFDITKQGIRSTNISVFSPELIRNPIDSASFQNPAVDDGEFVLLVNSDGTMAIFTSLQDQNIAAWSLQDTPGASGKFVAVDGSTTEIFVITQRLVNEETVYYLEQVDFSLYTDCASTFEFGSPTTVITGLDYLEGEEVRVKADGYVLVNQVVEDGEITITKPSLNVEVGLNFNPTLTLMPLNVNTPMGPDLYFPKKAQQVYVDYLDSLGIMVNGELLPDQFWNPEIPDSAPTPVTGFQEIVTFLENAWNPRTEITISQVDPLPMLIRGVGIIIQLSDDSPLTKGMQ